MPLASTARALATARRRAVTRAMTLATASTGGDGVPSLAALVVDANARDGSGGRLTTVAPMSAREGRGERATREPPLDALRARDWALLEHGRVGGTSFASAAAAFVRRAGACVARAGPATTVIGSSRAAVFPESSVAKRTASQIERAVREGTTDFPLAALSATLDESSKYYEDRLFRLRRLAAHAVEEISLALQRGSKVGIVSGRAHSVVPFQKLPPIRRAVKELEEDVRQSLEALNAAAETPNLLPPPEVTDAFAGESGLSAIEERNEAVMDVIGAHARRMAACGGLISELTSSIDSARELWELQLDGDRTRTVTMTFRATIIATSAAVCAVPAALWGMNMPNGLEASPMAFWYVAGGAIFGSTGIWYTFWKKFHDEARITDGFARELTSLQFILNNMDALESAFDAAATNSESGTTKDALRAAMVRDSVREIGAPSQDEVFDMIFKVYDVDGSHRISEREWRDR